MVAKVYTHLCVVQSLLRHGPLCIERRHALVVALTVALCRTRRVDRRTLGIDLTKGLRLICPNLLHGNPHRRTSPRDLCLDLRKLRIDACERERVVRRVEFHDDIARLHQI